MIAHSDSPRSMARVLQRSCLLALLGLLCLSNVLVQGQGTTPNSTSTVVPGTTTNPAAGTVSGTATGTATGTAAGTATGTATGTAPAATVSRSPQDPISSLTMLTPQASQLNPPIFPIGVDIPFSWEYDKYLLLQPTNLTIEAFLTSSPTTIVTIGSALPGNIKNYTWTGASQINATNPLLTAMYTLRIYDGQVGRNGSPPGGGGGYLVTYSGLKFGMYIPQAYTPGNQSNPPICATCEFSQITNDAARAVLPALMAVVTLLATLAVMV